mgnify:CR=1 FL=1
MAKKRAKKPGDRSTVFNYKQFDELLACLQSDWPSTTTRQYLIDRFGPEGVPGLKAICRWREKHLDVASRVIPHSIIQKKLKGVQFKVDVIGHLSRLVALCEDRMARGLEQEEQFGMPLAVNDGVMQVYLQAIRDYVKVAQDLGIMKAPVPSPFLIDARTQQLIVTPETLQSLRETVKEIKKLEAQFDRPRRVEVIDTQDDHKASPV